MQKSANPLAVDCPQKWGEYSTEGDTDTQKSAPTPVKSRDKLAKLADTQKTALR